MKRFFMAGLFAALLTGAAGASIPPPPPGPPSDLPQTYGEYQTRDLWNAYIYWVIEQTGERRERAYEALELHNQSAAADWYVERDGPRYHLSSYWLPSGTRFAFERLCPYGGGEEACRWRYRSAFYDASADDVYRVVFETFDGTRFAEHLRAEGVTPERLQSGLRTDFGLADTVHAHLDGLIVTRDLSEDTCPGVGEAIEALAEISLPLSAFETQDGDAATPPIPGGDDEVLTVPVGALPYTETEVVFRSRGSAALGDLVSRLVTPVYACLEGEGRG